MTTKNTITIMPAGDRLFVASGCVKRGGDPELSTLESAQLRIR